MPGDSGVTVATTCTLFAAAHRRPAFPAPSDWRRAEARSKTSGALRCGGEVVSETRCCRATERTLILRSLRSKRLEGWRQWTDSRLSFETRARSSSDNGEAVTQG